MSNQKTIGRSDNLTMDNRVRSVMEWILQGNITSDIISQCIKDWEITERQSYEYIKLAKKQFKEARKGKLSERIDFYLAAKMKLYNSLKFKDTPKGAAVANDILDSMAKLEGAITEKVDVTSKGKQIKPEMKVFDVSMEF